jgi:hypothetical protein
LGILDSKGLGYPAYCFLSCQKPPLGYLLAQLFLLLSTEPGGTPLPPLGWAPTAGDLLGVTSNAQEESLELGQARWRMGHPGGIDQVALLVQHHYVMVIIRPIDASKEHDYLLQDVSSSGSWWPHTPVLEARPSINLGPRRVGRGSAIFP